MAEERNWFSRAADVELGRRLANREAEARRIGAFEGVPAMGLDVLGSTAYGPEAALVMLMPLGAAGLHYIGWVTAPAVALLVIVYFSYRQTIEAYPRAVDRIRLRIKISAQCGIARCSGVDDRLCAQRGGRHFGGRRGADFCGAFACIRELCPRALSPGGDHVVNLRGRAIPGGFSGSRLSFLFACSLPSPLGWQKQLRAAEIPRRLWRRPFLRRRWEPASLWLLRESIRERMYGMTGVEAVSNGVEPFGSQRRGSLSIDAGDYHCLPGRDAGGNCFSCPPIQYRRDGSQREQLPKHFIEMRAIAGRGWFYYVAISSVLLVLIFRPIPHLRTFREFAASWQKTAFCRFYLARAAGWCSTTQGITVLAIVTGVLLIGFGGVTDRLIRYIAVGAFLAFHAVAGRDAGALAESGRAQAREEKC